MTRPVAHQICVELKLPASIEEEMPWECMFAECPKADVDLIALRDEALPGGA